MAQKQITVPPEARGERIDYFLARVLAQEFSRTKLKQWIDRGSVLLNGREVKAHAKVMAGDQIEVSYEAEPESTNRAEPIELDVVYEDRDILVVNKPAGLVVHPGCGNLKGTLVNALLHYTQSLSSIGGMVRPGIVHRLDKETSGLLVVAKNDIAHRALADQFKRHAIVRVYWVVVKGIVQHDEMRIAEPLGRASYDRKRVVVKAEGKPSVTNFKVLKRFQSATLVEARPETGRTHQIRVHLRVADYPVLGDLVYGVTSQWIHRQALHAKKLGFLHPRTQEKLLFDSDLPSDMESLLAQL